MGIVIVIRHAAIYWCTFETVWYFWLCCWWNSNSSTLFE